MVRHLGKVGPHGVTMVRHLGKVGPRGVTMVRHLGNVGPRGVEMVGHLGNVGPRGVEMVGLPVFGWLPRGSLTKDGRSLLVHSRNLWRSVTGHLRYRQSSIVVGWVYKPTPASSHRTTAFLKNVELESGLSMNLSPEPSRKAGDLERTHHRNLSFSSFSIALIAHIALYSPNVHQGSSAQIPRRHISEQPLRSLWFDPIAL